MPHPREGPSPATSQALSGGQQALAALALSFALQAQLPAPFFFLDEIDACAGPLRGRGGRVRLPLTSQPDASRCRLLAERLS